MSAFMHGFVAWIRATHTHVPKTPRDRSHQGDTCHASNTLRAGQVAKSRKWIIAGLR